MALSIKNYIPISRKLFEHRFWCEEREYSRFEAWLDLLQMARFEDGKTYIGNKVMEVRRGQVHATYRFLSQRWKWSTKKVGGFLDLLAADHMISKETHKETGQTLLTICNYHKYNMKSSGTETSEETTRKQPENRTETNKKNEKEIKGNGNISSDEDIHSAVHCPEQDKEASIDYKKLVEFFNCKTNGVFGTIRYPLSEKRKGNLRARIREYGKASFTEMVEQAVSSDFLKGENKRGFRATFDWMILPNNYQKILEGNYENRTRKSLGDNPAAEQEFIRNIRQGIQRGRLESEKQGY